jgi:hypothetical protein
MKGLTTLAANAAADAVAALLDGGSLCVYGDAGELLAKLAFGGTAFRRATGGVCVALPITPEPDAPASGRAASYRCLTRSGIAVFSGTAGAAGKELVLDPPDIRAGAVVAIDEYRITVKGD